MTYHDTFSPEHPTFILHDCIATDMIWENGNLTFLFPEGIILGKELAPKGRYLHFGQSAPAKLTFVGANLRFFHVYEPWDREGEHPRSAVTEYDLPEVIEKVARGEWSIEFIEEYRSDNATLFQCDLWHGEYGKGYPKHLSFAMNYNELICEWNEEDNPEQGVDLFADDLHFLGNTEEGRRQDLCLHGKVTMRVNGHLLADEVECCVTASALRFLRSLSDDHKTGEEEFLFPCCGNMLIPSEDGKTVTIIGCQNGTDLAVATDRPGKHTTIRSENTHDFVSFDEYRAAVLAYAKQVLCFLQNSPERLFEDDYEKKGYEAFLTEYKNLMEAHSI